MGYDKMWTLDLLASFTRNGYLSQIFEAEVCQVCSAIFAKPIPEGTAQQPISQINGDEYKGGKDRGSCSLRYHDDSILKDLYFFRSLGVPKKFPEGMNVDVQWWRLLMD